MEQGTLQNSHGVGFPLLAVARSSVGRRRSVVGVVRSSVVVVRPGNLFFSWFLACLAETQLRGKLQAYRGVDIVQARALALEFFAGRGRFLDGRAQLHQNSFGESPLKRETQSHSCWLLLHDQHMVLLSPVALCAFVATCALHLVIFTTTLTNSTVLLLLGSVFFHFDAWLVRLLACLMLFLAVFVSPFHLVLESTVLVCVLPAQ